jgi:anti-repressor protein
MRDIQIFDFNSQNIHAIVNDDREMFLLAQDVCSVLDITNVSDACSGLDDEDKLLSVVDIGSSNRERLYVSESGFYQLVFKSRKPEAKLFQKWVTKIVLPSIRATGTYESPSAIHRKTG